MLEKHSASVASLVANKYPASYLISYLSASEIALDINKHALFIPDSDAPQMCLAMSFR